MPSRIERLHEVAARYSPWLERAVRRLTSRWRAAVDVRDLASRWPREQEIETAAAAPFTATPPGALRDLQIRMFGGSSLDRAHWRGGQRGMNDLPRDVAAQLLDADLRRRAALYAGGREPSLVREIGDDTRSAVRAIVQSGVRDGLPPAEGAARIKRVIGLTERQAVAVYRFRQQLEARSTLGGMAPDDRRLNPLQRALVRRQMAQGNLTAAQLDRIVDQYRDSLVQKRALDIARTETFRALNAGQLAAWLDAQDRGLIPVTAVKRWIAVGGRAGDGRTRLEHRLAHAQAVALNATFEMPLSGDRVPAPPHQTNCRCVMEMALKPPLAVSASTP